MTTWFNSGNLLPMRCTSTLHPLLLLLAILFSSYGGLRSMIGCLLFIVSPFLSRARETDHWALLGFTFTEKDDFPGAKGDLFFASHGSWNSTNNVGALIQRVTFDQVTGPPYGTMTIVDCQDPTRLLSAGAMRAGGGGAARGGAPGGRGRGAPSQGGSGRYARPVDLAEALRWLADLLIR